ncbi:hypothetical protein ACWD7V_39730, partial [Streptomyces sp. NPDC005143]
PGSVGMVDHGAISNTFQQRMPIGSLSSDFHRLKPGHRTLLTAFGAGLTWGAVPPPTCREPVHWLG